jgi:hypothetical protein
MGDRHDGLFRIGTHRFASSHQIECTRLRKRFLSTGEHQTLCFAALHRPDAAIGTGYGFKVTSAEMMWLSAAPIHTVHSCWVASGTVVLVRCYRRRCERSHRVVSVRERAVQVQLDSTCASKRSQAS